uniref:Receptor-like protein 12 n=1 Tax=Triticum urartu TaxID=4572 RepID=A0A8R7PPL6_TRIUA
MYLRLASCNISKFPNVLRHLHWIEGLDLSHNQIHGAIPQWAWEQWTGLDLFFLNLSHNKFNNVGYETFLPFHIHALDLSFNMFEGQIPIPQNSGDILDYSSNHFSSMPSNISTQLGQTVVFKASRNLLSGKITPAFCGTNLEILDLSYNNLSGPIPSCLLEDTYTLKVLNLKENQLHGKLPRKINESCALEALDFSGNRIEGDFPRSLAYCKYLEVLDVGNNQINDLFPCWIAVVPRLQVLVIKLNKFFGPVASSVPKGNNTCGFPSIRILDLASNNFSGRLTNEWFVQLKSMAVATANETSVMQYEFGAQQVYQFATVLTYKGSTIMFTKIFTTLVFIDVSDNAFHGSIPKDIGELVLLHGLNLSHNFLTGTIPAHVGHLSQLEVFDLSSNELSGVIPHGIASLDFLTVLNLSYNSLEGRIPESPHFLTFSNRSFLGNDLLCGPPLSKKCSGATPPNGVLQTPDENSVDIMLFLFVGLGFGVGFAVVIIVTWVLPIRKKS